MKQPRFRVLQDYEIRLSVTDRGGKKSFGLQYCTVVKCPNCSAKIQLFGHQYPINEVLYPHTHSRPVSSAVHGVIFCLKKVITCECGALYQIPDGDLKSLEEITVEVCTPQWLLSQIAEKVSPEKMWRFKHLTRP